MLLDLTLHVAGGCEGIRFRASINWFDRSVARPGPGRGKKARPHISCVIPYRFQMMLLEIHLIDPGSLLDHIHNRFLYSLAASF